MKTLNLRKMAFMVGVFLLTWASSLGQAQAQNVNEYGLLINALRTAIAQNPTLQFIQTESNMLNQLLANARGSTPIPNGTIYIKNCVDLQNIQNNLAANYILMNDIDCSATNPANAAYATSPWKNSQGFIPIGTQITDKNNLLVGGFQGSLNGNYYSINNLYIQRTNFVGTSDSVGLFGYINDGTVKNLHLGNVLFRLSYSPTNSATTFLTTIGALASAAIYSSTITNVAADGHIYVTGAPNSWIGGLVGNVQVENPSSYSLTLSQVSFKGTIETPFTGSVVGGIAGVFWGGTISQARVNATLTGGPALGGIVGSMTIGAINQSSSYGTLLGGSLLGGIVGITTDSLPFNTSIADCYSSMNVISASLSDKNRNIGGLVGYASSRMSLTNSYATGIVYGLANNVPISSGGLVGSAVLSWTYTSSYWNTESTGQTVAFLGGTNAGGETTDQLQNKSTFVGWDFRKTWDITNGQSYPQLKWEELEKLIPNILSLI